MIESLTEMNRQNRNIRGKSGTNARKVDLTSTGNLHYISDSSLSVIISEHLKGRLDQEDVKNDPDLPFIENSARAMISDHQKREQPDKEVEKFIIDALREGKGEEIINEDISEIKNELRNSNVRDTASAWVSEWHGKMNRDDGTTQSMEIRSFIKNSIEPVHDDNNTGIASLVKKGLIRTLVKYFSLSAAAIITFLIILKSLFPAYNPEKLFNAYYEPLNVISPVTRGSDNGNYDNYVSAIEMYRVGDYQTATLGFTEAMQKNNTAVSPRFFMGITQMALGNYDQSIFLLSGVTALSGEYFKEALWYLGLGYIKTGEKEKALACFENLAQTPGFYKERADKIVRRLK